MRYKKILSKLVEINANISNVLSMNCRNLNFIYPNNQRCDYPLADDKLETKTLLEQFGVPHPVTHQAYRYFYELNNLEADLKSLDGFVIKPASGHGGNGIKVIVARNNEGWIDASGKSNRLEIIRKHITDIVFGVYSFDLHDAAIIEQLVIQHSELKKLSPLGLADVRVITCKHDPIMAMLRVPSEVSNGKSNLHQGAIGVGVNIENGVTCSAVMNGRLISEHPDTGHELLGIHLPDWEEVLKICNRVARNMPLKYLGFDIALSNNGPLILELNVRPGIEIQNANGIGMRAILESGLKSK